MQWGASTANFYPELTEDSLDRLLALGFRHVEVFLNTESETEPSYLQSLRNKINAVGATVTSVHPYLSGIEPYLLFSQYDRRFQDGLRQYERIFKAAAYLGAPYVVMHGDRLEGVLSQDDSIARFEQVYDLGLTYGVQLLQENVVRFRSSNTEYLRRMRQILGEKAGFVFDFKQCRRAGHAAADVLDVMGDGVKHIHLSDATAQQDCLPPGKGNADLVGVLQRLQQHFHGAVVLELYRTNFDFPHVLWDSVQYLQSLLGEK